MSAMILDGADKSRSRVQSCTPGHRSVHQLCSFCPLISAARTIHDDRSSSGCGFGLTVHRGDADVTFPA